MDSPEQRLEQQQQMVNALKLENQFKIIAFNNQVDAMTPDQVAILAKDLFLNMQYQRKMFLELTKQKWGIETNVLD